MGGKAGDVLGGGAAADLRRRSTRYPNQRADDGSRTDGRGSVTAQPGAGQKGTMAKRGRGREFPVSFLKGDEHRSPRPTCFYRLAHPLSLSHVYSSFLPCRYLNFEPRSRALCARLRRERGEEGWPPCKQRRSKESKGRGAFCRRGHARWQAPQRERRQAAHSPCASALPTRKRGRVDELINNPEAKPYAIS
jgi:hypothetical protein